MAAIREQLERSRDGLLATLSDDSLMHDVLDSLMGSDTESVRTTRIGSPTSPHHEDEEDQLYLQRMAVQQTMRSIQERCVRVSSGQPLTHTDSAS